MRASRRQQLLRFEYFDPLFRQYGEGGRRCVALCRWPLLAVPARSSVTRFFRSTIDRGNFGIVQRLDSEGEAD